MAQDWTVHHRRNVRERMSVEAVEIPEVVAGAEAGVGAAAGIVEAVAAEGGNAARAVDEGRNRPRDAGVVAVVAVGADRETDIDDLVSYIHLHWTHCEMLW